MNTAIECFCIHARNLFEFLTKKSAGDKNYAYAAAFVPGFRACKNANDNEKKDDVFRKICQQITHLSFDRVTGASPDKFLANRDMPETMRLLVVEIKAFVGQLSVEERKHWDLGVAKCGLAQWGF